MKLLRNYIRAIMIEAAAEEKEGDLLTEPDEVADREEDVSDESTGVAAIAGYTLPLGASNSPTTLQQRGDTAGQGFGGAKPLKKKKKKRRSKP
jgi:hypothetical protein|tara:strand:+ start:418 stop:696 length:279 start_codon:yes stop_codon:yes gene_type:complete